MGNTGRQIIRQQEFAQKVGFKIFVPNTKHALLETTKPPTKPTTRRPTSKPTSKPNGKPVYDILKKREGVKEKKGSVSLISIPIVLVVLSALIAFFIIRRRRSKDSSIETSNGEDEIINKNIGKGTNKLDDPSDSKLEIDPSKEKFQQIKDRFNQTADQPEPSKPAPKRQPGKVNPALIGNIESVGAFRSKTEQGQENFKKNPPPIQSKSETKDTKSRKDNNISAQEKSPRQPNLPKDTTEKEEDGSKIQLQSKPEFSKTKDTKPDKMKDSTKLNSSATIKKEEGSKQANSPRNMTKVVHEEKIEAHPNKDQLIPVDREGTPNAPESKQKNLESEQNDIQLLGGLTKTRTRGRAGRQPPSRSGRKNALKDGASSSYQM